MHKIIDEPKLLRYEYINGKQVPVYSGKVETIITNTETGETYESEEACQADIDNPNTTTTIEKIRRDVNVTAPAIVSGSVAGK